MTESPLDELIEKYFEGTLSPEETERLTEALRSQPDLALRFARTTRDELLLAQLHLPAVRKGEGAVRPPARVSPEGSRSAAFHWTLGLAAAAVIALAGYWAISPPAPDSTEQREQAQIRAALEDLRRKESLAREAAARARAERERLEAELERQERERRRLAESRRTAADEQRRKELEQQERELEKTAARAREQLDAARERERQATVAAPEKPATPQETNPPATPEKAPTRTVLAVFERAQDAHVTVGTTRTALKSGDSLLPGHGLTVEAGGAAVLVYPDKTRLEFSAGTEVAGFGEGASKRLRILKGAVSAHVSKQPQGQRMVFESPHAEVTVLGTTLRLVVDPDPKRGTRLEVEEGRVLIKNLAGKTADVTSGRYAVAAAGVELAARLLPRNLLLDAGFEKNAQGWQPPDGKAGISVSTARSRTGAKALQMICDPKTRRRLCQTVAIVPGETYEFSVWLLLEAGGGGSLSLIFYDAAGKGLPPEIDVKGQTSGPGWNRLSGRYTAPPTAAAVKVDLNAHLVSGIAWYDDCEVIRVER